MNSDRNVEGSEFDWFAVDECGRFALFATAGCGPVPRSVRESMASHDAIGDSIDVAGWGGPAVWQSYSKVGLFVYDWSAARGCYLRIAEPSAPLGVGLLASLASCPGLPALALSFSQASTVDSTWQDGA